MYFRTDLISRDKEIYVYMDVCTYLNEETTYRRCESGWCDEKDKNRGRMDKKTLKKSNSCESPKKMVTFERILSFFRLLLLSFPLHFIPFLFIYFDLTSKKMFTSTYNSLKLFLFSVHATSISGFQVARKLPNEIFTWLFGKFVKRLSIRGSHVFSKNNSSPRQATFHLRYC